VKHGKGDAQSARRTYTAANEQAAQIIIRNPGRYSAGSLAQQWALRVISAKETKCG
jgi:hypothetical protein